jgi:putative endonuclease
MYCTYILYSAKCDRYYIGYTSDITARLIRHNEGKVTATKNCKPYIVKATKFFATEAEARSEELRLKKMKSRVYLESLIAKNW